MSIALLLIIVFVIFLIAFNINVWIGLAFTIWSIISVIWFIKNMGNKHGAGHWHDWIWSPPVIGIVTLFAFLDKLFEKK
jgi:hypothetical protein